MDAFTALADPIRRDLLGRLAAGTARVVDLAAEYDVSRPAVSRHLRVLSEAGLVTADDHGRERHYRLDRRGLAPITSYLADLAAPDPVPRFAESALDGLDLEVRRTVRERTDRPNTPAATTSQETA